MLAMVMGVCTVDKNVEYLSVYREYLGKDYVPGENYTTLISNHISWHVYKFILIAHRTHFF